MNRAKSLKAKDLMSREVVTLSPLTEAGAAARVFTDRRISGAPVVGKDGEILGIVSQTDLTRFQADAPIAHWGDVADGLNDRQRDETPVIALMTPHPVVCDEETPIEEVAHLMQERRIHRVLVSRSGRLVGIISAMDLLRVFAAEPSQSRHEA